MITVGFGLANSAADRVLSWRPSARAAVTSPLRHRPSQSGELGGGHLRRGQDAAVRAECEQRRDEHVITAEDREAARPGGEQGEGVAVDPARGVLQAGLARQQARPLRVSAVRYWPVRCGTS